jgi:hypothetical protein
MWAHVKAKLRGQRFRDADELFAAVSAAWDSIDMGLVNDLVRSFRARCRVCVEVDGQCLNRFWDRVTEVGKELAEKTAD